MTAPINTPSLATPRPIKIVGRDRERDCEHGPGCRSLCVCPQCGADRTEIRATANGHRPLTPAERWCHAGHPEGGGR